MPTKADFEAAAATFQLAADQVGTLTAAAEDADSSGILRGGSLGRQVPDRIATSTATASTCQDLIETAVKTCRDRVSIIADYEAELKIYDIEFEYYSEQFLIWDGQLTSWIYDSTHTVPHPGHEPEPPLKPIPPPEWADVRRL